MTTKEFTMESAKTAPSPSQNVQAHGRLQYNMDLLHSAMGVCTESGELLDAVKKHVFYGKPLDTVNLVEEVGDILWYLSLLENAIDWPNLLDVAMEKNVAKLRKRYGDKFTESGAINRNTEAERSILEG